MLNLSHLGECNLNLEFKKCMSVNVKSLRVISMSKTGMESNETKHLLPYFVCRSDFFFF